MQLHTKTPLLLAIFLFLLTGCATFELQTNVKMTKSVFLKPVNNKAEKTIYISLKNISQENMDILPLLEERLKSKGYTLVKSAEDAHYVLFINILFANNLREANAVKAATGLGIAGGAIAAGSNSNTGDSLLIGAGIALASGLVGKALEDETYRAVVDVVVDEKSDQSGNSQSTMGDDYKEHKTRVLAEAVQTDLKLEEALPILTEKVAIQIANIF